MLQNGLLSKRKNTKNLPATSKSGHMKKKCPKYVAWHVRKGKSPALFCSKDNLLFYLKIPSGWILVLLVT